MDIAAAGLSPGIEGEGGAELWGPDEERDSSCACLASMTSRSVGAQT